MKKVAFIIAFLFSLVSTAQNFDALWKEVHQFELENLPKSALTVVNQIYDTAKKEHHSTQIIKSLLYKSKFALTLEEEAQLLVIQNFEREISESSFPTKNILESILADLYWSYFQQNRYTFYNRTTTEDKIDKTDFRTWDLKTIFTEIQQHYNNSLSNSLESQLTQLENFDTLLKTSKDSKIYRPTLYDFLAQRAIDFFKNEEQYITRPAYKFELTNKNYLANNVVYTSELITSKDSSSNHLQALHIYKNLTLFHLKDKNPTALIHVTLERLNFVKQNTFLSNKDELFLETLQQLKKEHFNHEAVAEINFEIAKLLNELGEQFEPLKATKYQFKKKEAIAICNEVISKFPQSTGAIKCEILKNSIQSKLLNIQTENYVPIATHSKLLVRYKNIENLYFNAYAIYDNQYQKFQNIYNDSTKIAFINTLSISQQWKTSLKSEEDSQQHTTEVLVPALKQGMYLITASVTEKIGHNHQLFVYAFVQATDLAIIEQKTNQTNVYQIVNRNTGLPLANAHVNIKNYNTGRYNKPIHKNFTTDQFGEFSYQPNNTHRNIIATVTYNNDRATFGDFYWYKSYYKNNNNKQEKAYINSYIFTDRSIYRPGQIVYFKSISIKKYEDITAVFTNQSVEVSLKNTAGEIVKSTTLALNEFGAVSGEFLLPTSGLTGNYTLEVKATNHTTNNIIFNTAIKSISVEEYKRPKFETSLNPISGVFKLNDTVTVSGIATAYAGNYVSNATVSYRVKRTAIFPRWLGWRNAAYFNAEEQEICSGETTTNNNGTYEISFKALPDLKVDPKQLPTFNYTVFADVTDINGETRSTETIVKVGYHTLEATVSIASKIDKNNKDHVLDIRTNNLNNTFVPTKGSIKIYKLKAPKQPLRTRPWAAPDYQLYSRETFEKLFPHEAYTDDDNLVENWSLGTLVFEKDFDTNISKKMALGNIKNWMSGNYKIVLTCKDTFNQLVKDEQFFEIFGSQETSVADNKLFVITTDKQNYQPLEDVQLSISSASKEMTVMVFVEKNHTLIKSYYVTLKNETKTLKIPVTTNDYGGFAIKYHFVNYNSFQNGIVHISVPYPSTDLEIETLTFRDKIQPGSEQTWSFKILGPQAEKVTSEVLASMYDASLDAFKPHYWNFNPIQHPTYYSYSNSNAQHSFSTLNFNVSNQTFSNLNFPIQNFDTFNWFGFSFTNNYWVKKQYLNSIRTVNLVNSFDANKPKGYVFGTVLDSNGMPLPGVSVQIKGTNLGVITDFDGKFSLKAAQKDKLIFSFIGMITTEVLIDKFNIISVVLTEDNMSLEEVVVTGYGKSKRKNSSEIIEIVEEEEVVEDVAFALYGNASGLQIRGAASVNDTKTQLLYVVDGVIFEENPNVNPENIVSINVLKETAATALYGKLGANGAIVITTKSGTFATENELQKVQARTNFNETAFFYPHITTNQQGEIQFNFTIPEALTKWKLQLLAHTKQAATGIKSLTTVTQKELMVLPNPPRFLREGDVFIFSSKISNLTSNKLQGHAQLVLTDAISGKEINHLIENSKTLQPFQLNENGNTQVQWKIIIPKGLQAVQYKIVAKAGNFSDGEQNVLPVLSNRMLVTETLPMWVRSNQTKTFQLQKLQSNTSTTLSNHRLTLEITSNPAWYAVQSLPYLMEYPYECAEQTFSRYYSNALANYILKSNPRIKAVFDQWKTSDALISNLEKNEQLKSIIIQETPWLRDAQNETEQKKRIALLFDFNTLMREQEKSILKLNDLQFSSGGFPWFKGSEYPNRYITQHIAIGFGHLFKLGVTDETLNTQIEKISKKAVQYLDVDFENDYKKLLIEAQKIKEKAKTPQQGAKDEAAYLAKNNLNYVQLHYLYMRSFYNTIKIDTKLQAAINYYTNQSATYWKDLNLYSQGITALIHHRNNNTHLATSILKSLKENSITNEEMGMYWKQNTPSWYWYQAPIETQALMIEVFSEIENNTKIVDELKVWLLKNKQTNSWKTTKQTTEAVYALLLQGSNWLQANDLVEVTIGNQKIEPLKLENVSVEAGTGYYKTSWNGHNIKPEMGSITLSKKDNGIAWGSLYWQYFEDLNKITSSKTPLKLTKKLFLKTNSDTGKKLVEINENSTITIGDLITVRVVLQVDRTMEFVHMKDMRASGLEPINVLSGYKWQGGLGYYESTKDAATHFFFDYLPKGVYVFEYDVRANNAGSFSNGITTIQSMYAPEFSSHSEGVIIQIHN